MDMHVVQWCMDNGGDKRLYMEGFLALLGEAIRIHKDFVT